MPSFWGEEAFSASLCSSYTAIARSNGSSTPAEQLPSTSTTPGGGGSNEYRWKSADMCTGGGFELTHTFRRHAKRIEKCRRAVQLMAPLHPYPHACTVSLPLGPALACPLVFFPSFVRPLQPPSPRHAAMEGRALLPWPRVSRGGGDEEVWRRETALSGLWMTQYSWLSEKPEGQGHDLSLFLTDNQQAGRSSPMKEEEAACMCLYRWRG
eukprot:765989-Hanusia_phi.AAC.2